jgi:hypothetical protein
MGLEFRFDEISLDQQVSSEQVEIDLYDELITISDAAPEEQVRLLAIKPALDNPIEGDGPESIRVTGSPGKEQLPATGPGGTTEPVIQRAEVPIVAPSPYGRNSQPLNSPNLVTPANQPQAASTPHSNGQKSEPQQPATPAAKPADTILPPTPVHPGLAAPPRQGQRVPTALPPSPPVIAAPANVCPDCGQAAGELDMICIECGAFIG